ncbi:unnamed protein product (macronuclear) [Paramecium tetraurelia]|uniref:non-specific serine/threonine protein kinase n=1 Tax=Paramecium tetraurelia TaxID=5888 RepID=A0E3P6_PARTE|nr:uncharacterized protein GSPATT00023086001 [Paramecium tetraurelia]CAK89913.1 unnamed protein product [Paramecium tetraurelia]|eukprot:XP_001457310.1 hypothetical protein (macronuclear) [Paramecium tetraurelia strain d4-2]
MKQRPTTAKVPVTVDTKDIHQLYELDSNSLCLQLGRQYQLIGSNLSHFLILNELGKGSFGVVYKVKSTYDGLIYVLKKINLTHLKPKQQTEALKEAQLLRTLKHPNIISYYVSFIEQDNLCIVMEYAEGGDLQKVHNTLKQKCLKEPTIWEMSRELAQAIQHLHENNIIHRDIKTLNVFLTKDKHVKLGDLGVSKIFNSEIALDGTRVGTPLYLAPELVQHQPYDYKVDIWALGCIVFQLATLEPPFQGENLITLGYSIVNHSPKPLPSQYSSQLSQFISKLLEKIPALRPSIQQINSQFFEKKCPELKTLFQIEDRTLSNPNQNQHHYQRPQTGNLNKQIAPSIDIEKANKIKKSILLVEGNLDQILNGESNSKGQKQIEADKIIKSQQYQQMIREQSEKLEKEKLEKERLDKQREERMENEKQLRLEKQLSSQQKEKSNRLDKLIQQNQIQLDSNHNEYQLQKPIYKIQNNKVSLYIEDFDNKQSCDDQKSAFSAEKHLQIKFKYQKPINTYQSNIQIRPLSAQARSSFVNISSKSKLIPVLHHNQSTQEPKKFTVLDLNPDQNEHSFHQEIPKFQPSLIKQPDTNEYQHINNKEISLNKTKENIRIKSVFTLQKTNKPSQNKSQERNNKIIKHYTLKDLEE